MRTKEEIEKKLMELKEQPGTETYHEQQWRYRALDALRWVMGETDELTAKGD